MNVTGEFDQMPNTYITQGFSLNNDLLFRYINLMFQYTATSIHTVFWKPLVYK